MHSTVIYAYLNTFIKKKPSELTLWLVLTFKGILLYFVCIHLVFLCSFEKYLSGL